jgi:hypothetical protein
MWVMKVLVCCLNSSPARWCDVPLPGRTVVELAGFFLTKSRNSLKLATGTFFGLTTTTCGTLATRISGIRSFSRS